MKQYVESNHSSKRRVSAHRCRCKCSPIFLKSGLTNGRERPIASSNSSLTGRMREICGFYNSRLFNRAALSAHHSVHSTDRLNCFWIPDGFKRCYSNVFMCHWSQTGPPSCLIPTKDNFFNVFILLVLQLQTDGCFLMPRFDWLQPKSFIFCAVFPLMPLPHVSWKSTNSQVQSRGKLSVHNNAKWSETIL